MYEAKMYKTHISHVFSPKRNKHAVSFFTIGSRSKRIGQKMPFIDHVLKYIPIQRKLKFDNSDGDNIKNEAGKIFFKKYKDGLFSSDFTGCIMAVFSFNEVVDQDTIENINDLTDEIRIQEPFVAHVYASGDAGDMKCYFASLANSGKITIEAMYKPRGKKREVVGRDPAIGEIKRLDNEWIANTYDEIVSILGPAQYDVSKGECLKNYNSEQLQAETYKMKGFIGCVIKEDDVRRLSATNKAAYKVGLKQCGETNPNAISEDNFNLLSEGSKKDFIKGTKLYKGELPEWIAVKKACC